MKEIVLITCANGAVVGVSPLPPILRTQIALEIAKKYPEVDKASYALPDPNAFLDGGTLPAENNPAYKQAVETRTRETNTAFNRAVMLATVRVPECVDDDGSVTKWKTRETVIAEWSDEIEQYRYATGDNETDAYLLALNFGYVTDLTQDQTSILLAAGSKLPLTQEEVISGVKFFRYNVQRRSAGKLPDDAQSPGIQTESGATDTANDKIRKLV